MKIKLISLLFFLSICTILNAQIEKSLEFYNSGNTAFAKKNYALADSFFTLSISLKPHPDTYFNRAACRQKLNDQKGYCMDLSGAANMGDKEAQELFVKQCAKRDTLYKDEYQKPGNKINYLIKEIIESCELTGSYDYAKYSKTGDTLLSYYTINNDTVFRKCKEITMPVFLGGEAALRKFIQYNIQYPVSAREEGLSGLVKTSFVIDHDGNIKKIVVTKPMKNCNDCNREAVRVISVMPRWIAGKYNGRAVKVVYELPITYKIM